MEHIEEAGIHSGDSACSIPPIKSKPEWIRAMREQTRRIALELGVVGLLNIQFAVKDERVYVLEVNPRASRTVPFVSKATGVPWAKVAARCMAGIPLAQQGVQKEVVPPYYSVKESVFPFVKFPGVDTILGPEMKSTGEVMGVGRSFGEAFIKSQVAAGVKLPKGGRAFISVRDGDKRVAAEIARELVAMGFAVVATRGTARVIQEHGVEVSPVNKVAEGRPHIVDMIKNGDISLIVNTVEDTRTAISDSRSIRTTALAQRVTYYTTIAGARAACTGMKALGAPTPYRLQDLHAQLN
jgi:carbamoyl-phosphate synthase large subunit